MLDLPKVSIIVPVYNVEKYLSECLDSLLAQTFGDFEIICVNDGSTDSSLDILNEYAAKDNRIRIITQENAGPSKARNNGIDNAIGDYIYFMDSDDILDTTAIEELYGLAVEDDLDLIIFKLISFDDETGEEFTSPYYEMDFLAESVGGKVFSHNDLTPQDVYKIAVSPPGKLFKRDLIGDLRFPEGVLFEDNPFFVECMFKAERAYFYEKYLYRRRIRRNSITTSHNRKNMDFIPVSNMLIDITKRFDLYEKYREGLFEKIMRNVYLRFSQIGDEHKKEFFEMIKEDFLSKKDEYDNDEAVQNADEKLKEIFYSAIESENAREYELSIKCIDLSNIIEKKEAIIEQKDGRIRAINSDKDKLIRNARSLSTKLNEVNFEYKQVKKENKKYKNEIDDLKYVNSQLMSSTSWKVTKPIRFVGDRVKK